MTKKNFALIGAAGYIAPRHMRAIKDTNNILLAALDPSDSVGIIDSYFPAADFFVEFERFDRHIEKIRRQGTPIDYISICSPNYLHDAHIRFGLRAGAHVICEKPVVLNPWNIDALSYMETETGRRVYCILQLRLHPAAQALKQKIDSGLSNKIYDIDLTYLTARGHWYYASWKGNSEKSGGIASNIGVHFFDLLLWIFGDVVESEVHVHTHDRASGYLQLERARIRWFLGIDYELIPEEVRAAGARTYRSLIIEDEVFDMSSGFSDLHTRSYEKVLSGKGFGLSDARASIQLVHDIRNSSCVGATKNCHPLTKLPLSTHPFKHK